MTFNFSSNGIQFDAGGEEINNEDITVTSNGVYTAGEGYTGLGTVDVNVADIPAVTEELNVTPTTSAQTIRPTQGKDGFSPVNVSAVTAAIDQNISASNIKKDVVILGVTGDYVGTTPTLITKNITQDGTYNASSDNADGYSSVTVNVSGGVTASLASPLSIFPYGNSPWKGIVYDGQQFIAINEPGAVIGSSDGISWTTYNSETYTDNYKSMAFGNGIYIGVGEQDHIIKATIYDLTDWNEEELHSNIGGWKKIIFGGNTFVIMTDNGDIGYSSDGLYWQYSQIYNDSNFYDIIYDGTKYIAVGYSFQDSGSCIATSTDLRNWTIDTNIEGISAELLTISYDGTSYVILYRGSSDINALTSTDLQNWTTYTVIYSTNDTPNISAYGDNRFIAFGTYEVEMVADNYNLSDWSNYQRAEGNYCIAYGGNKFIVGCEYGQLLVFPT